MVRPPIITLITNSPVMFISFCIFFWSARPRRISNDVVTWDIEWASFVCFARLLRSLVRVSKVWKTRDSSQLIFSSVEQFVNSSARLPVTQLCSITSKETRFRRIKCLIYWVFIFAGLLHSCWCWNNKFKWKIIKCGGGGQAKIIWSFFFCFDRRLPCFPSFVLFSCLIFSTMKKWRRLKKLFPSIVEFSSSALIQLINFFFLFK